MCQRKCKGIAYWKSVQVMAWRMESAIHSKAVKSDRQDLEQGSASIPVKGQIVNILDVMGHMVTVATTQL